MKVRLVRRKRLGLLSTISGLTIGTGVVLWSPMIFYLVLGRAMPWQNLADVGQAYGGASALLSAAALCGIGFSLILQSRQLRQELTSLDKQRHFELIKLALDNPEFFEVIDVGQVTSPRDRQKVYANLMMNYWLAMWELGEIGEAELRNLTKNLFKSDLARTWWQQQQGAWMTVRTRRRRRLIAIADEEWTTANTTVSPGQNCRAAAPRGSGNGSVAGQPCRSPSWGPVQPPTPIADGLRETAQLTVFDGRDEGGEVCGIERQHRSTRVLESLTYTNPSSQSATSTQFPLTADLPHLRH